MLISNFISTCLSHRTFKLNKFKMDSGLSTLNFPPPGFSTLEKIPPSHPLFRTQGLETSLIFPLPPDPLSPIHWGHPIGSTSKMSPHCLQPSLSCRSSCQDLLSALHPPVVISYISSFTQKRKWSFKDGRPGHASPCLIPCWLPNLFIWRLKVKASVISSSCPPLQSHLVHFSSLFIPSSSRYCALGHCLCWANPLSPFWS